MNERRHIDHTSVECFGDALDEIERLHDEIVSRDAVIDQLRADVERLIARRDELMRLAGEQARRRDSIARSVTNLRAGEAALQQKEETAMRCPYCGSDNTECVDTRNRHAHICHGCDRTDEYAIKR